MTTQITDNGKKALVVVKGELDTVTSSEFQEQILPLMNRPGLDVELDLGGVDYISSRGLRVILGLAQSLIPDGSVKVTAITDSVREIFTLTGFDKMFL